MNRTKIIVWLVVAAIVGGIVWKLNTFFATTVDWPLVVLNAKSDALKAREEDGNYTRAMIGQELMEHLEKKGIAGQVTLSSANSGTEAAVVVSGLSARSCHGLEKHPELVKAFERIEVQNGLCIEGSTVRFWFK